MKITIFIIVLSILSITINIINYDLFLFSLSIIWYLTSILIIYSGIKYSLKYKFIQLNIKKIISAIKSKSNNNIHPLSSLCISLAAKIGVGSLSGIALAIHFGGLGTIFWIMVISLIVAINTYIECILGIKYRQRENHNYLGGPSYYIKKCLNNKTLSYLYSILIIITYSVLFLSIQTNTIVSTVSYFNIKTSYIVIILFIITLLIIIKGLKGISTINTIVVPVMLLFYFILGIYITFIKFDSLPTIFMSVIQSAFNIKNIIPVFLIGMQRAIFITESSLGTSAIAASTCDNNPNKQGMLEVLGIYITIFIVCITTFLIIVTSDYQTVNYQITNGIDLVLYAFNYHFGNIGTVFLSIITILFAFSTIISSYYFGESNLQFFTNKKIIKLIFIIIFLSVIIASAYIKATFLWNLTDYFIAILAIINIYSILKIVK